MPALFKTVALSFVVIGFIFQIDSALGQTTEQAVPDSTVKMPERLSHDSWFGKDKTDHAMVSAGLVAAQYYLLHNEQDIESRKSWQIAATSTLAIGLAKEIYDRLSRRGTASWKDLVANLAGIGLAVGMITQ